MGNFVESRSRASDLRRAVGLLVGRRSDFLGEFVNFRDHAGNLT